MGRKGLGASNLADGLDDFAPRGAGQGAPAAEVGRDVAPPAGSHVIPRAKPGPVPSDPWATSREPRHEDPANAIVQSSVRVPRWIADGFRDLCARERRTHSDMLRVLMQRA